MEHIISTNLGDGISATVETITPDLARDLLEMNTNNRRLDEKVVNLYAQDIKNGNWILSGEPIIISSEGYILDGQHRLAAVIKADIPIKTLLVWGSPADAFKVIDTGKVRTGGDIFYIAGVNCANTVSGSLSRYFTIKKNRVLPAKNAGIRPAEIATSKQVLFDFYKENKELTDSCVRHGQRCYSRLRALSITTYAGYEIFLAHDRNHPVDTVQDFFTQVTTGENITNSSCLALRNVLIRKATGAARYTPTELAAYISKAWNAFITGKELSVLRYSQERDGRIINLL